MNNTYLAFGLSINAPFILPAPLAPINDGTTYDVVINYGETPENLENPIIKGIRFQACKDEFLLCVDNIARYHVVSGNRITITPLNGASEEDILLFLMGSAMGALLHQRNVLVLHAGAVLVKDQGVLFLGASGMGKSTLTAFFHKKGYPFLADDLCAISNINGSPFVLTSFQRMKLWEDSLQKLLEDRSVLKPVRSRGGIEKYCMPVYSDITAAVPVKDVFVLQSSNNDNLEVNQLRGLEKINALVYNTYRFNFLNGFGGKASHFKQCVQMGSTIRVFRVVRPKNGFLLDELSKVLEEKIHT